MRGSQNAGRGHRLSGASKDKERVASLVDQKGSQMIRFLQELVMTPSISGTEGEGNAQRLVVKELQQIDGLTLDIWEPDPEELKTYPLYPVRLGSHDYEKRPNVVGTLKGTGGSGSLILNGHIDCVSPEPVEGWKHDPWGAKIHDGRLYGRGAYDMKAGIVAMLYALKCIREAEIKLKGDLILESVVEEETGSGGTISTLVRGYKADAAIVTEGTGTDRICIGAGGTRWFTIRVLGKSESPDQAQNGVNAIGLAGKIYGALMKLDDNRNERLRGKHRLFESPKYATMGAPRRPTDMTLGILKAGDAPDTVAGWAELQGRVGFPPSETGEEVMKEIEDTVRNVGSEDPWMRDHLPTIRWFGSRKEGYRLDPETPIVQTLKRNVERITKKDCELYGDASCSDANHFIPKLGPYGGIPAPWYGPGGAHAHAADEYVIMDEVFSVTKALALTIMDWCRAE